MLQDPPPSHLVGRTLGHYEILAVLGKGGMGVVYLAEDQRLHRHVALKLLPLEMSTDPERLKRFRREAKTVASLSHPNVVTLHAVEEADGYHFLVMELVEGRTLNDEIPPGGLPLRRALEIAAGIAGALASAHERGVLHRDLKPSNVMVNPHGWVKVLDFGLAKLRPQDEATWMGGGTSLIHTQEGKVLGTPSYMSPEQLRGLPAEERSDIFSFGLVLYEMMSGNLPFAGENSAERIAAVLRDPPQPLAALRSDLPESICRLVERCLAKEIGKRPASAAEVRDEIARIQRELEISALMASGSLPTPASPPRRSRRWEAVGAAAVLVAFVVFGIYRVRPPARAAAAPATDDAVARPAIAVLPLGNFTGDPDYFVDGMTDGLIGALARYGGVRVISRQSAMHYKGSTKLLTEIARELGVDYVVEGSVQRDGERIRLQTQVVRPDPEEHLMAETFERPAREVLSLHADTARAVAIAVRASIEPVEQTRMANLRTVDPAAYEAYLQGRYWASKFGDSEFLRATGYFQRAVALDPSLADAWSGLAYVTWMHGLYFSGTASKYSEADAAARRALQVDDTQAGAYVVLSYLAKSRWDWLDAEAHARRAVELDPSSAFVRRNLWHLLAPMQRLDEARIQAELAAKLDPLSAQSAANLGMQLMLERRDSEAEEVLLRALEIDGDYGLTHGWLWMLYARMKKDPERGKELASYVRVMGFPELARGLEERLATEGYERALSWVAMRASEDSQGDQNQVGFVAGLLAESGRAEEALRWLQFGFSKRVWELPWLAVSPDYNRIRSRPDFQALLGQLGLPRGSA